MLFKSKDLQGRRVCFIVALVLLPSLNVVMFLRTSHDSRNLLSLREKGWVRPSRVIGHVHIAKTAGTEINGELALRFERICGHKGYSYDYFQYNNRVSESDSQRVKFAGGPDSIRALGPNYKEYSRGRVPEHIMVSCMVFCSEQAIFFSFEVVLVVSSFRSG